MEPGDARPTPQEALAAALRAVDMHPRRADAHLRLAEAQLACGDSRAGERAYRRAVQLDPGLEEAVAPALRQIAAQSARESCRLTLAVLRPGDQIGVVAVSPGALNLGAMRSRVVATAGGGGGLRVWCLATGALLQDIDLGPQQVLSAAAWSPNSQALALATSDGTVALWRARSEGLPPLQLAATSPEAGSSGSPPSCIAWAPSSDLVAWADAGGDVRLWAPPAASLAAVLKSRCPPLRSLFFDAEGDLLVATGAIACEVWDWRKRQEESVASISWDSAITSSAFLSLPGQQGAEQGAGQGPLLLTCHATDRQEGRLLMWDVARRTSGWVDGRLEAPCITVDGFAGALVSADACCAAADGPTCLAVACADGSVRVLEVSATAALPVFEVTSPAGGSGRSVAQAGWQGAHLRAASNAGNLVRYSTDGRWLAVSGGSEHCIDVYDAGDGTHLCAFAGHASRVHALVFLGPRELLSASSDGCIRVWRLRV